MCAKSPHRHLFGAIPNRRRILRFAWVNIAKKYWGYIVILLVIYGWTSGSIGVGALAILSAVAFIYTLFQAPMWCGAPTRQNQHCRNNADGVLRGCWIREHRWQKTKMLVRSDSWGRLFGRLFSGINGATATISALGTFFSGIAAVIGLAVN